MITQELLEILCCPKCKGELVYDEKKSTLTCTSCTTVYEVKDGIPILLPGEDGK
ncbi:MAG: Trm112 family protein [Bacteroidota bacterium]|jgi:hypothetical protein